MLSNNLMSLRNEITSNFRIYEGEDKFKFAFTIKSKKGVGVDFSSIYEKMFATKKNHDRYAKSAITRFYGNVSDELKSALDSIVSGNFEGLKARDPNSIKILNILAEIVDVIESSRSKDIISSVRDADTEFNQLKTILSKLTGAFKKEDADRFKVISRIYSYAKEKNSRVFNPIVKKYSEISTEVVDYATAIKSNKKAVTQLLELFNANESDYVQTIDELVSLSPKLFGKDIVELKELITDQVSDNDIDNYKHIIRFYCQHLDALVELAKEDLSTIVTSYSAVDDKDVEEMREAIKNTFGPESIVDERLLRNNQYFFALSFTGRFEPVLEFIEQHDIKTYTVLMVVPSSETPIQKNPSLQFLLTALNDDLDDAIDQFGRKPQLDFRDVGGELTVHLIGNNTNSTFDKESAMVKYTSILAVAHGFDAMKLPFVQKFV